MLKPRARWFAAEQGASFVFTFCLVSSLFLLWGFCNGLIDVMDKHFQDELHLTKAQSAWVQTAHYLGYALMALPAGLLARSIGYKGGIIAGLLVVSLGGFWFIAATQIASFWAFLLGVSVIAVGLTLLETVANPYTTVLGPKEFGPFRINLAQSLNGIGWMLGPLVGGAFFYSAGGTEVSQKQLQIPYIGIALLVLALAVVFYRAKVPDVASPADPVDVAPGQRYPRIALVAAAFPGSRPGTVSVRCRPGRHIQLLYQLHGGGDSPVAAAAGRAPFREVESARAPASSSSTSRVPPSCRAWWVSVCFSSAA